MDLGAAIGARCFMVEGGHEFDGREIAHISEMDLRKIARRLRRDGVRAVAIVGVFSQVTDRHEQPAAAILCQEHRTLSCSLSHEIGRLGLLERENATGKGE